MGCEFSCALAMCVAGWAHCSAMRCRWAGWIEFQLRPRALRACCGPAAAAGRWVLGAQPGSRRKQYGMQACCEAHHPPPFPAAPNPQTHPPQVNASDARGKADSSALKGVGGKLANAVKEMSTNTAVSYDRQGHRKKVWAKGAGASMVPAALGASCAVCAAGCTGTCRATCGHGGRSVPPVNPAHCPAILHLPTPNPPGQLCLIMDEVDGMSGGDRGGVGDLIAVRPTAAAAVSVGLARTAALRACPAPLCARPRAAAWAQRGARAVPVVRLQQGVGCPFSGPHALACHPSSSPHPSPTPIFPTFPPCKADHQGQQGAHHLHLQRQVLHQAALAAQPHHRDGLPQVRAGRGGGGAHGCALQSRGTCRKAGVRAGGGVRVGPVGWLAIASRASLPQVLHLPCCPRPPPPLLGRPTVQQIGKRMMDICKAEGLAMNQATLDALIQAGAAPGNRAPVLLRPRRGGAAVEVPLRGLAGNLSPHPTQPNPT